MKIMADRWDPFTWLMDTAFPSLQQNLDHRSLLRVDCFLLFMRLIVTQLPDGALSFILWSFFLTNEIECLKVDHLRLFFVGMRNSDFGDS